MRTKVNAFLDQRMKRITVIILDLILIALTLYTAYILQGAPALTPQMALRRRETQFLIGPGEIIDKLKLDEHSKLFIVDEGDSVALFKYPSDLFSYRDKNGTVTCMSYSVSDEEKYIFAFDEVPDAAYAELELFFDYREQSLYCTYTLSAYRECDGLFIFLFRKPGEPGMEALENYALTQLSSLVRDDIPAAVRFYGESGELISQVETTI